MRINDRIGAGRGIMCSLNFQNIFGVDAGVINDLSSSLINFVRSRDPVGEKTTKIGTYKGGRCALARRPFVGGAAKGRRSYFGGLLSDRVS